MTFRFRGHAVGKDPTGYFYPRWDQAQAISVLAPTKDEANRKAWDMLGYHPRFGSQVTGASGWALIWDSVDEEVES